MVIFVKMILKMKNWILVWMAVAGCLIGAFPVLGQKKAMDHDVYDGWQRVDGVQLSPDGRVLVYQINPQEGDGELIVRNSTPLNKNGLRLPGGKPRSGRAGKLTMLKTS